MNLDPSIVVCQVAKDSYTAHRIMAGAGDSAERAIADLKSKERQAAAKAVENAAKRDDE